MRGSLFIGFLLSVAGSACTPVGSDEPPLAARPDGERGHGWFATAWGPEEIDYVWRGGQRVYDGDLVIPAGTELLDPDEGRASAPLLSRSGAKWEMGSSGVVTIPYEIDNTGSLGALVFDRTRGRIRRAMDHWETYVRRPGGGALLRFTPHAGEERWVQFQVKHNGGVCYVALRGTGKSRVDSDPGCGWQTYVHEIGHVLTYRHEQKRDDREGNVIFYPGRTVEDGQFTTVGGNKLGTPYDSYSIMHYPSCMFSTRRCSPSTPDGWVLERVVGPPYITNWWDRDVGEVLSSTDVCGTRALYDLPCAGGDVAIDGGVTEPDAGVPESDAGVPEPGVLPALLAVPGMLQSYATGVPLCAVPSDAGTEIALAACDETVGSQRWGVSPTGALRNEALGLCAEPDAVSDGAFVEGRDCRTDTGQRWRFGAMELVNGSSGTCIGLRDGAPADGQPLVHGPCTGELSQRFAFVASTHQLMAQGWCLTAGETDGADVVLRACDGSDGQRWIETNGGFASGGLCMRVRGGPSAPPGAAIEVTVCNGAAGQMWGLRGEIAYAVDELCLAAGAAGDPLRLATCDASATGHTSIWWPREACTLLACADLGASCGTFDDGCGGVLECGTCPMTPVDDAGPGELEPCDPEACGDPDCTACIEPITGGGCGCATDGPARNTDWLWVVLAWTAVLVRSRRRCAALSR